MRFLIVSCFILLSSNAGGQWVTDPAVNTPVALAPDDQRAAKVISDREGGAIVVWYDRRTGANWDIYAQRFDALGSSQWQQNGVAVSAAAGHQWNHQAVPDGFGGAIVAWQDMRSGNWDIYAQRIAPDGSMLWISDGIAVCTAPGDQEYVAVVADGEGGAFIAWEDFRAGSTPDIYAQRLSDAGTPMWQFNGVAVVTAANHQRRPQLARDAHGGVFVVWHDHRVTVAYAHIYAQRLNGQGEALWQVDGIGIRTVATHDVGQRIIPDGTGGAIVSWENNDIYAQRIDSSGSSLWTEQGVVVCNATLNQWGNRIIPDGEGGAIISWIDERLGLLNADIYGQRIGPSGVPQWTANGIRLTAAPNNQVMPEIAPDDSGGAIVVWQDNRISAGQADIYAQRVDAEGNILWGTDGIAVCTAPFPQLFPSLVSVGRGEVVVAWEDRRPDSHWDLYAQYVRADGSLGGPLPSTPTLLLPSNGAIVEAGSVVLIWSQTQPAANQYWLEVYRMDSIPVPVVIDTAVVDTLYTVSGLLSSQSYMWKVKAKNMYGWGEFSDPRNFQVVLTTVREHPWARSFRLHQNYPNPFNPATNFRMEIGERAMVALKLYDVLGREVATLIEEELMPGSYDVMWDARGMPGGVYFYRLSAVPTARRDLVLKDEQAGALAETKKLVVLR